MSLLVHWLHVVLLLQLVLPTASTPTLRVEEREQGQKQRLQPPSAFRRRAWDISTVVPTLEQGRAVVEFDALLDSPASVAAFICTPGAVFEQGCSTPQQQTHFADALRQVLWEDALDPSLYVALEAHLLMQAAVPPSGSSASASALPPTQGGGETERAQATWGYLSSADRVCVEQAGIRRAEVRSLFLEGSFQPADPSCLQQMGGRSTLDAAVGRCVILRGWEVWQVWQHRIRMAGSDGGGGSEDHSQEGLRGDSSEAGGGAAAAGGDITALVGDTGATAISAAQATAWADVGRAFMAAGEMEYAKAALLRSLREDGEKEGHVAEGGGEEGDTMREMEVCYARRQQTDLYLAAIMQAQGELRLATRLYLRVMARSDPPPPLGSPPTPHQPPEPATHHEYKGKSKSKSPGGEAAPSLRLATAIRVLTMVPPLCPEDEDLVSAFREDWVEGLDALRAQVEQLVIQQQQQQEEEEGESVGTRSSPPPPPRWGLVRDPNTAIGVTPFHLAHQGQDDRRQQKALGMLYATAVGTQDLCHIAPHVMRMAPDSKPGQGGSGSAESRGGQGEGVGQAPDKAERRRPRRPVKVGFASLNMRDHSIGRMMVLLVAGLAERRDEFEVHVFQAQDDDDPNHQHEEEKEESKGEEEKERSSAPPPNGDDAVQSALRGVVAGWHALPLDLQRARAVISHHELDILVYPDIGMEIFTYLLSFSRLAPVQAVWWGHPVTPAVGCGSLDYFLSLEVEVEEGQEQYEEQLVRFDLVNTAPFAPDVKNIRLSPPPAVSPTAADGSDGDDFLGQEAAEAGLVPLTQLLGLDGNSSSRSSTSPDTTIPMDGGGEGSGRAPHAYLIFGRLFKLHPSFYPMLLAILERDPDAYIVLIHEKLEERWTQGVWESFHLHARTAAAAAAAAAVGDTAAAAARAEDWTDRFRFIHHWNYPSLLHQATAVLDTHPYGGCLTVLEALSAGVPVVTLPSEAVRGRYALAMYEQMGGAARAELVAADVEAYVGIAVRLGTDSAFRAKMKEEVARGYRDRLHRHHDVVEEWAGFLRRALRMVETT